MKLQRASQSKGIHNRSEAWACVTANLAFPGSGSLIAGRAVGYYQAALTMIGLVVSLVSGGRMAQLLAQNYKVLTQPDPDPLQAMSQLWQIVKWPLLGFGVFGVAFLWAAVTSFQIMADQPKIQAPPRIV